LRAPTSHSITEVSGAGAIDSAPSRPAATAQGFHPDGKFHSYHLNLAVSPEYRGLIIGLAIEPAGEPLQGDEIAIKSIVFSEAGK